jgi:hypothetical protein
MGDDEPQPVWMAATCHTLGCPVEGQAFENWYYPNPAPPMFRGQCAGCGETVTDLVPSTPPAAAAA